VAKRRKKSALDTLKALIVMTWSVPVMQQSMLALSLSPISHTHKVFEFTGLELDETELPIVYLNCAMGAVTVLYEEAGNTSRDKCAFELNTSSEQITLQDLVSAFPLGPCFSFSIRTLSGSYVDVVNPATRLYIIDGVITARVVPLSRLPLVSLTAATAEAIRCSRLPDQSHKHSRSSRGSSSGSGSWQQQQQSDSQSQQSWTAELSKRRRSVETLGDNLQQQTSKVSCLY
jgi:hypothetical protein